jgi:polysaccharide biosynthesis transport protein
LAVDDVDVDVDTRPPVKALVVLKRRAWLLIPCIIVGGAVAYFVAHHTRKQYSATSSLLFQTSDVDQALFGFTPTTDADDPTTVQATDVTLASEPLIAVETSKQLHTSPARVAGEISIGTAGASYVVNVTARNPLPAIAALVANTYAAQVVTYQQETARAQDDAAARQLQSQINNLPRTSADRATLETRLSDLQSLAALQSGGVQIAGRALVPTSPSSPSVKRDIALGLIAGLLVGVIAMLLAERIDVTLRDSDEAAALVDLPVLGIIPASRALRRSASAPKASPVADAFRLLRTQLSYFNIDREITSLLITSSSSGDGKSTVAWHLASTAAALSPNSSVLIIDADLRRPRVAELAGAPLSPGLSDVLTHGASLDQAIRTVELSSDDDGQPYHVHVLTAGGLAPNPAALLQSERFRTLLRSVQSRYDLVLVDAPPPTIVSDAIPLMTLVDGVLMVVRVHHTRREDALALQEQLSRLRATCLGVIINGAATGGVSSYYRYSKYPRGRATPTRDSRENAVDVGVGR